MDGQRRAAMPQVMDSDSTQSRCLQCGLQPVRDVGAFPRSANAHRENKAANNSVGLRSMPARFLLMDEVNAYPPSASTGAGAEEGDPVHLAVPRTGTFANRQIALASTPTIAEMSRIAYLESALRQISNSASGHR